METQLTPDQAWADFWDNVRPVIWRDLTAYERQTLQQARRAAEGKIKKKGKVVPLGMKRLQDILKKYAPNRYTFQTAIYLNRTFDIDDIIDPPECIEPGCPLYAGKLKNQKDWICPVCGIDIKWNV